MKRQHRLISGFLVIALCLSATAQAFAISGNGIGIYPRYSDPNNPLTKAWFLYDSLPGETIEDSVTVSNITEKPVTLEVYAVDSTTNNKGGFALEGKEDPRDGVGAWVKFIVDGDGVPVTPGTPVEVESGSDVIVENVAAAENETVTKEEKAEVEAIEEEGTEAEEAAEEVAQDTPAEVQTFQRTALNHPAGEEASEVILSLEPGEEIVLPFTFTVPTGVEIEPGEHSGAIVTQEIAEPSGPGLHIATRIGARIYYTAPGEVHRELALGAFTTTYDKSTDSYRATGFVKNLGNVTTKARANLTMNQIEWGTNNASKQQELQISPGSEREVNFSVPSPKWGKHGMALQVVYEDTAGAEQQLNSEMLTFWSFPFVQAIWVGLLIALNVSYICARKMRAALLKRKLRVYTVKKGDTIDSVAARFGMRWKRLARLNHLHSPYTLHTKQKLNVIAAKSVKGTRKFEFSPVRVWATVVTSVLTIVLVMGTGVWGVSQVADMDMFKNSVLEIFRSSE